MQASPVAIVGIAAQLPSGPDNSDNLDHKQFFDFLLNKGEAYEKIPLERFNIDSFHGTAAGQVSTKHGTFLKHTSLIDHVELGITAKDAKAMSLSTRKLIELAFLALLDSGVDYRGENVGCFASGIVFDVLSLSDPDPHSAPGSFSGPPAMIANRISYHLDLTGPSVPVDTACSSSLTATHLAMNSIRMGECDTAVVGGVQLNHRFVDWVQYSMGGILAPDGRCKPFDESADGFSRGEAGVAIVLKRLDHAIRDNDHIYATILGTGINSAGAAAPVNAPVAGAQRDAMRRAWAQTGRRPSEVDFVEVHATGTAAGDPAEANWVGEAFERDDDDQLLIGSVKGNIGHTEIAAFLSSLTKVVHTFRTGIIPPNVGLSAPNPAIKWDQFRLHVPTEPTPLPVRAESGRALVALCSSGIGGANGHVVLEAPPVPPPAAADAVANADAPRLLVAGGLSPRTASAVADSLTELVAAHPDELALIATVYGRRARQMTWRSFATYVPGQTAPPKFSAPVLVPRTKPAVAFVFAGQGPQHLAMGRELYAAFPVFRKSIDDMDAVYASVVGESLVDGTALFKGGDARTALGDVWPIAVTLPALAMLQCALVDLLASLGITPDAVIGHSAGETAVLYASGAGSKAMVVELAVARGQAMAEIEHLGGSMAALSCSPADAHALIRAHGLADTVDVACHNAPDAVTLAGPAPALDALVAAAKAQGRMATRLRTRVPVHSRMMAAVHAAYTRRVAAVFARHPAPHVPAPAVAVFSTLTGAPFPGPFTADYFWQGTLRPVRFTEASRALLAALPAATLLELSPHPVLTAYLPAPSLPLLRRPARTDPPRAPVELPMLLAALGRFTTLGHSALSFNALNALPSLAGAQDFPWPAYPFQPKAVPYHSEGAAWQRQFDGRKGPLNYKGLRVNRDTHPVLAEHIVKGEPIMPAAGFIEMALEFGAMVLYDVEFSAMLSLSAEKPTPVQVALDGIHWTVKTSSSSARKDDTFDKVHAQGFLSMDAPSHAAPPPLDLRAIQRRCKRSDLTHFYDDLKSFADYGPAFQRVVDSYDGVEEALVLVRGADDDLLDIDSHKFHPAILDACLHTMVHTSFTHVMDKNVYFLPSKVGRLVLEGEMREGDVWMFPEHVWTWVKFTGWGPSTITADFVITAIDGTRLCTLTDVEVTRHESVSTAGAAVAQRYDVVMQPLAVPSSSSPSSDVLKEEVVKGSEADMGTLHAYLDWLAAGVIRDTLAKGPVTGKELDRQRYAAFARAVAAVPETPAPCDAKTVQALEKSWPEMMEITRRLASVHGKVFETSKAAVEVLYKDDIMTRFYKHYDWASLACAERFRAILSRISQTGGKRVVRVLEVGSGTGALTRHLAAVVASFPPESLAVEFVISDVSKELLPRQPYPWCRYTAFDLSKSAAEQGFAPASFDVITGFDVLHVVPDMAPALAQLNALLAPGGSLLIGDLSGDSFAQRAPGAVYFDFVFGSFAEWFAFQDGRAHCAMSGAEWMRVLGAAGFGGVAQARFERDPLLMTLEAQKVRELNVVEVEKAAGRASVVVFRYARGSEGELRTEVLQRDASAALSLWLFSAAGFDGDAGAGLARSLGREFPLWDVHLVAFDGFWTEAKQYDFVRALSRTPTAEAYIHVSPSGAISVPRVVPAAAPPTERPFSPSQPWTKSDSGAVVQTSVPQPSAEMATVQVLAMSPAEKNIRGFVGRLVTEYKAHLVVGVAHSPAYANFLSVPRASLASLPSSAKGSASTIAGFALGALVGSLALGSSPRLACGRKALLSHMGRVVGPALRWYLALLGLAIVEPKVDTPAEIAALGMRFDVVVAGSDARADVQGYARALKRSGRMLVWSGKGEEEGGVVGLLRHDPAAVGEAMERAVRSVKGRWPCADGGGVAVEDVVLPPVGTLVPSEATLFDPAKAYVLVGGIGGLGIRIAMWMYERGARYLVLTSRSGRESLTRVQDRLALRIVNYLDSLPDLTFRLEASDATSHVSTSTLMRSIPVPVGGCMLLSVVLADRTFAFQEENDFDKVFASKTGACRVIERCLPKGVASLDFFVAFSSVVGLFGNGGQTNYSSANTALDGIVREWDNAFTFVLPAISDGGGLASETGEQGGRLGHLTPWGMSAQRVCACLEDGIRKLGDGPFWQYIPDLDWTLVQKYMGTAPLYSHLVGSTTEEGPAQTADSGKSLQEIVMELLDVDASEFSADVPFTAYGLDSLSAARLSLALRPHVAISQLQLLSDVCLNDLLTRAEAARDEEQAAPASSQNFEEKVEANPKVAEIEGMISKYTTAFKQHTGTRAMSPAEGDVVLVTGTTGAIGTAMLARLATMPSVARVYAFNRKSEKGSATLRERQAASFESRGYDSSILDGGKIVLVEGDQTVAGLGISSSLYDEIRNSITSIIHNAWPVNFTASLASLEPAVRSVRVLVDLALGSSRSLPPRLLFLSSIGLLYNRKGAGAAPEEFITDVNQVIGTGYSEGKYVGERILQKAAEETALRPVVVRAGQVCGGPNGSWSTSEWFPSLVKSSIHLECLPEMQGDISWVPLQGAANALIDMRNADQQTLHISHPRPVSGSLISGSLSKALNLPLVPFSEWLSRLQKSAGDDRSQSSIDANPAIGLLDYFRTLEVGSNASKEALGLPKLSVAEGVNASPALRDIESLTTEHAEQWLANWRASGFLQW